MKLGVSGGRVPTQHQIRWMDYVFGALDIERVHHAGCVGADAIAHTLALRNKIRVWVHPSTVGTHVSSECLRSSELSTVLHASPYPTLIRAIVAASDGVVAVPDTPSMVQDWTWYMIDFAERMNKPITICMPDGTIERRMHGRKVSA